MTRTVTLATETGPPLMSVSFALAAGILSVAVLLAIVRAVKGPDNASRASVGDLASFGAVMIAALVLSRNGSSITFDAVTLFSLLGVISTAGLARVITRGRR